MLTVPTQIRRATGQSLLRQGRSFCMKVEASRIPVLRKDIEAAKLHKEPIAPHITELHEEVKRNLEVHSAEMKAKWTTAINERFGDSQTQKISEIHNMIVQERKVPEFDEAEFAKSPSIKNLTALQNQLKGGMKMTTKTRNEIKKYAVKRFQDTGKFNHDLARRTDLSTSSPFKNLLGEVYINSFAPGTFNPHQYFDDFSAVVGGMFNPSGLLESESVKENVYRSLTQEFFGGEAAEIKINSHNSLKYLFIKLFKTNQDTTINYMKQLLQIVTSIKSIAFETRAQRIEEFFNSSFFVNNIAPENYLQKKGFENAQQDVTLGKTFSSDPRLQFSPVPRQQQIVEEHEMLSKSLKTIETLSKQLKYKDPETIANLTKDSSHIDFIIE